MASSIVFAMAFTSGLVIARIDNWKIWVPLTAVAGLATGLTAKFLGVV